MTVAVQNYIRNMGKGTSESDIITGLKEFGISDSVIKAALKDAKSKISETK